jgi:hypothetical protein
MATKKQVKPQRTRLMPHPDPQKAKAGEQVKGLALDFKIIGEQWNVYELENGSRIKIKVDVVRIEQAIDLKTDKPLRRADGSPIYGAEINVNISVEDAQNTLKKP